MSRSIEDINEKSSEEQGEYARPSFLDADEEKRLVRKLDRRILPIACLLYLFAYLDRSNLGNSRLQGLPEDILGGDPTGLKFDWVNSVFFFSYILCQVPATIASKLFPPRAWMAAVAVGWGLSSTLMSTCFNFGSIMTARVFLGVFEAGFGPALPLYLSFWYTKEEMGLRIAYWFAFAAVSGAFGGIIAFGIQTAADLAIHRWRLLFIVEGIPAILMGAVALCLLPNRPESTSFLTEREREIQLARMNRGISPDKGATVNRVHIWYAFKDWRVYTGGVIYFGLNAALASISAFLPTILLTLGFGNAKAQLLTVPPYAVSAIVLLSCSYLSDRMQTRGPFMAGASFTAGLGYLIMLLVPSNYHARYFAVFCITSGTYTTIGLTIAWFAHNLGSETKRAAGIPLFQAIGQCGSVLGSHLFPKTQGPEYIKGFGVICGLEFLAAACAIILSISYRMDNARRNKVHGEVAVNEEVDVSELADKAPNFRYIP